MMNEMMRALRDKALTDPLFRQALLDTRNARDPLSALCDFATASGFPLTIDEVINSGEEFADNQMKSTNGGNPMPYDCFGFDDAYEMFFISIQ